MFTMSLSMRSLQTTIEASKSEDHSCPSPVTGSLAQPRLDRWSFAGAALIPTEQGVAYSQNDFR